MAQDQSSAKISTYETKQINPKEQTNINTSTLKWSDATGSAAALAVNLVGVEYRAHVRSFVLDIYIKNTSDQKLTVLQSTFYNGVKLFMRNAQGERIDLFTQPSLGVVMGRLEIAANETKVIHVSFPADMVEKITSNIFATIHTGLPDGKVSDPISPPIDVAAIKKALASLAPEPASSSTSSPPKGTSP